MLHVYSIKCILGHHCTLIGVKSWFGSNFILYGAPVQYLSLTTIFACSNVYLCSTAALSKQIFSRCVGLQLPSLSGDDKGCGLKNMEGTGLWETIIERFSDKVCGEGNLCTNSALIADRLC